MSNGLLEALVLAQYNVQNKLCAAARRRRRRSTGEWLIDGESVGDREREGEGERGERRGRDRQTDIQTEAEND